MIWHFLIWTDFMNIFLQELRIIDDFIYVAKSKEIDFELFFLFLFLVSFLFWSERIFCVDKTGYLSKFSLINNWVEGFSLIKNMKRILFNSISGCIVNRLLYDLINFLIDTWIFKNYCAIANFLVLVDLNYWILHSGEFWCVVFSCLSTGLFFIS